MTEYNKTVNLGDRPTPINKTAKRRINQIDRLYDKGDVEVGRIKRPEKPREINESVFKRVTLILALVLLCAIVYFMFFKGGVKEAEKNKNWYSLKLTNGEVYYGQIQDETTDPVVIENVYYNYDQINKGKETSEIGNLRLVKRGEETYGPNGTMKIVRTQILYMEPLKEESKVLKAILSYEK